MRTRIIMLPVVVLALGLQAIAAEFYVAPDGDDANAGSRGAPFQTLERARDAVREHRERHGLGEAGISVVLREGRYFRDATFSLAAADSGEPGAPVVYKAAAGEAVYLDGGHVLEPGAFKTVTDEAVLERLLEPVRGKVLQADLRSTGITEYGDFGPRGWGRPAIPAPMELFIDGIPQTVARWPNDRHISLGEVFAGGQNESDQPGVFEYNTDRAARWTEAEDLHISGLFGVTWAHDTVGIAEIDLESGTFTTKHPHSYGFRQPGFPGRFTTQYYAVNLLEEIEVPGEYYIHRDAGMLYFLPAYPLKHSLIQVSELGAPFVRIENGSHIHFRGLTFENGRDAGIVVSGGESNRIVGCAVRALGRHAISIRGGKDHGVMGCDIYQVGQGGVGLSGGDRASLTPAGHFVRNCDIHRYNRWIQHYNPAVSVSGVGNRVEHSHMHHALHQAITFGGNEHEFAFNEIHHVLKDISDMGSIYVGRNPTFAGNIIRHNFFHHLTLQHEGGPGVQAIFLDDDTIYVAKIFGNVFYKTGSTGVIKFHGGGGASVANNIAIQSPRLVQDNPGDVEGIKRAISKMHTDQPHGHGFPEKVAAMNISKAPYRSRYPYIYDTYAEDYNEGTPRWNNLEVEDDLSDFVDPDNLNFALRDDAPMLDWVAADVHDRVYGAEGEDIPFERIPFEEIGLEQDDHRLELGPLPFHKLRPEAGSGDVNTEEAQFWWTPSHNADRYRVRIGRDAAMEDLVVDEETLHNQMVTRELAPGEKYFWQVEAIVDQSRSNRGARPAQEEPWPFATSG
ncbi:MAG: right-handed parallel beta-helix repeat-containing protein [Planctomycetota bacterium]